MSRKKVFKFFLVSFFLVVVSTLCILFLLSEPGVRYRLRGTITMTGEMYELDTPDGRRFRLIGKSEFDTHIGKNVVIEGYVERADQLGAVIVESIYEINSNEQEPQIIYNEWQKPPERILVGSDSHLIYGLRWDCNIQTGSDTNPIHSWTKAEVFPTKLECVYLARKPFFPKFLAAHYFILFKFAKGGILDENGRETNGLVLSVEGYRPKGSSYSLIVGLGKNYGVSWILATWENYAMHIFHSKNEKFILRKIKASSYQNRELLKAALQLASVNREGEYYHTVTNNCLTNTLLVINRAFPEKIAFWWIPGYVFNFRYAIPTIAPIALEEIGLIESNEIIIDKTNFKDFLRD